jgi:hypothetical protein
VDLPDVAVVCAQALQRPFQLLQVPAASARMAMTGADGARCPDEIRGAVGRTVRRKRR